MCHCALVLIHILCILMLLLYACQDGSSWVNWFAVRMICHKNLPFLQYCEKDYSVQCIATFTMLCNSSASALDFVQERLLDAKFVHHPRACRAKNAMSIHNAMHFKWFCFGFCAREVIRSKMCASSHGMPCQKCYVHSQCYAIQMLLLWILCQRSY